MRGLAAAVFIAAAPACGRLEFERKVDSDAEIPSDADMPPSCDPLADFGPPVLIPELSDPAISDGTLRLLADEKSGYFWRGNASEQDIYFVSRPTYSAPFTVSSIQGINTTTSNELDPTPTSDGTLLVFRRDIIPGDDLYAATLNTPTSFDPPVPLTTVNSSSSDAQSFIPLGSDELYFQSKRTAAGDIYRSTRSGTSFGAPVNVSELATSMEEGDPVVAPDGLTIYFRSDRLAAFTGFNIFSATRASTGGTFGAAALVRNVNANGDDGPSWISPDGCRLYISANVRGNYDVYVATRGM